MNAIDKVKFLEHLQLCIEMAEGKSDQKVAQILQNLQEEIRRGEFDAEKKERKGK